MSSRSNKSLTIGTFFFSTAINNEDLLNIYQNFILKKI